MKLLGTGYPYEVVIFDPKENIAKSLFLDEESGIGIKKAMNDKEKRYIDIGGTLYFWSDVRSAGPVKVASWLDNLIFHSGKITKKENQKKVLDEIVRRAKHGRVFHDEEDVLNFLSYNSQQ